MVEVHNNEETENLVDNRSPVPIMNQIDNDLEPNPEEVESITVDNQKVRKEKVSLKNKRRKTRKMRTEKRNHGEEYQSENGKYVAARKLKDLADCRKKCKERFCDSDRQCVFNEYWSLGSHSKRMSFISSLITSEIKTSEKKKIKDVKKQKMRMLIYKYFLKINEKLHEICKVCYLATFDESKKFVENVQLKARATISGSVQYDMRGHHPPSTIISEERLEMAKKQILSIPTYESHYTRRDTQKRYLPSTYTLAQMYSEYKSNCDIPISRTLNENLVHNLNISIKAPKTDTCNTCDKLHMQINLATDEEKLKLKEVLINHQTLADEAYSEKSNDKLQSLNDPTKKTLNFDLQQCLPTPQLETNVVFYKRQLWVYNLTVHDCDDGQAYCYMWSEVDGGRGANQIGSCLPNI